MFADGKYTQNQLPSELFNAGNGDKVNYGGTNYTVTVNNDGTRTLSGGGSGGSGSQAGPSFNFDYAKAGQDALTQLTPYYQQKLDLANGDVALAKQYIEADYQRGLRTTTSTYNTETNYNQQQGAADLQKDTIAATGETREAQGGANNSGVYVGQITPGSTSSAAPTSDYYNQYIGQPLSQNQDLRRQAIQRAIQKQQDILDINQKNTVGTSTATTPDMNSQLGSTEMSALNDKDTANRNTQLDLNQQKQDAATQYTQNAYTQARNEFNGQNNLAQ